MGHPGFFVREDAGLSRFRRDDNTFFGSIQIEVAEGAGFAGRFFGAA
jgi:hypothetical protein